jgi:hypothetical protein
VVQILLGHVNIATTAVYLHLTERNERSDPLGRAKGIIWKGRAKRRPSRSALPRISARAVARVCPLRQNPAVKLARSVEFL